MAKVRTLNATEFKAKCLDILDRISTRKLGRVMITKRGQVVAMLVPPETDGAQVGLLHGFLRGSVVIPADVDLTAPVVGEDFGADQGAIHG